MLQTILLIILAIPIFAVFYTVFEQQGRKKWEAFVPFWNLWILIQIVNKSWWWMILLAIPFINFFVLMLLFVELSVGFKRNAIWEYFAAAVLPFLYFPYLIWGKKETFAQPKTLPVFKKVLWREWFDTIVFSVFAAAIVRMFFFENYTIPTSSMEKSMQIGDYVYVSKLSYGVRIPQTPLAFPLVHHTLPLTKDKKSYIETLQLKYRRMFQRKTIQRGDAVVFNFPVGDTVSTLFQSTADYYALCREYGRDRIWSDRLNFGEIISRPVDKRENFVKRCVGVAGDTFQIINQQIYINGEPQDAPVHCEFNYRILPNPLVVPKTKWRSIGVSNEDLETLFAYGYLPLTHAMSNQVEKIQAIEQVEKMVSLQGEFDPRIFPFDRRFPWNVDNFGPIYIPQKGATIDLTMDNLPLYQRIISTYEHHVLEVRNEQIFIDGKPASSYTFSMDYFWMMGDNRHNSADSRYWGFVPEDHIVGKPLFTWLSLDEDRSFPKNIRWKRMFKRVK